MAEIKISAKIVELRKKNNITQLELAQKLGVTDRIVRKWETGTYYPDITLLPRLADLFNVSIDYLLRGTVIIKQKLYVDYANDEYNDKVNNNFLSDGWKIIDMKVSGVGDGAGLCAVLMEKELFEI